MSAGRLAILISTLLLLALGLLVLASAQRPGGDLLVRQFVWIAAGAVCAAAVVYAGADQFIRWAPVLYAGALVLLLAVLFSRPVHGVRAWFDLYLFKVQPAELSRVPLALMLARLLGGYGAPRPLAVGEYRPTPPALLLSLAVAAVPVALVLAEPDIGLALGMLFILAAAVVAAGVKWRYIAAAAAAAGLAAVLAYGCVLSPAQRQRVSAWLAPVEHSRGAAWQMLRSRLAVGSGGALGKGWRRGDMNRLNLLPVKETDFIFAVLAEELGFVGLALALAAYAGLVSGCFMQGVAAAVRRGSTTTKDERERPYQVLCASAAGYFAAEAALNVAVAMGLLPTTGVTLPFISYGGSSMLTNLVLVGLVYSGQPPRFVAAAG